MSDGMLFEDPVKRARVEGALTELIINGRVKMDAARALSVLEDYELKGLKYAARQSDTSEATVARLVCVVREHLDGEHGRELVPSKEHTPQRGWRYGCRAFHTYTPLLPSGC